VQNNIIGKAGAWFEYDGAKIGQGREAAKQYLIDNPKVLATIEKQIKAAVATS
jgi:recombination protein RecA